MSGEQPPMVLTIEQLNPVWQSLIEVAARGMEEAPQAAATESNKS